MSADLREREDNIFWRVRLRGEWIYVYLLLEFQSQPDPFMALRMLVYVGLLYQELVKQKQLTRGAVCHRCFRWCCIILETAVSCRVKPRTLESERTL